MNFKSYTYLEGRINSKKPRRVRTALVKARISRCAHMVIPRTCTSANARAIYRVNIAACAAAGIHTGHTPELDGPPGPAE